MAMVEEAVEVVEEATEGIEGAAADAEGLGEAEAAEVEAEAAEAQADVSTLGKVVEGLKSLGDLTLTFTKFVVKNAAIGAILYGVTVALKKMTVQPSASAQEKQKYKKIKSVSKFITSASDMSKKVSDWLTANKDKMITLEGMQLPLISIFVKYTDPLGDVSA